MIRFFLGEVDYIDTAGLGFLISALAGVRKQGGELKLLKLTKKIQDVMQITKLYTVFDIFDNEETAIPDPSRNSGSPGILLTTLVVLPVG